MARTAANPTPWSHFRRHQVRIAAVFQRLIESMRRSVIRSYGPVLLLLAALVFMALPAFVAFAQS